MHKRVTTISYDLHLHNFVDLLAPQKAEHPKDQQSSRSAPKPPQIIDLLTGHFEVAAEHTSDNVHGQDNRAENSQFAEYIRSLEHVSKSSQAWRITYLLLPLVHVNADLCEVVSVRPA